MSERTSASLWTGYGSEVLGNEHMFASKRIDGIDTPDGMLGIMRIAVELGEMVLDRLAEFI
jgi:hypothetical protein